MRRLLSFIAALTVLACACATPAAADDQSICFNASTAPDTAIEACGRLISSGQDRARAYTFRGLAYLNKGDYDRAIVDYNEVIRLEPNGARYSTRGFLHLAKGDYDQAIADLTESIRLSPNHPNPLAHRGNAYRKKGDLDRALQDIETAIRLNPKYVFAYTYRGLLYEDKGDRERARADFSAALALPLVNPSQKSAHDIARERLAALTAPVPSPVVTSPPVAETGRRVALVIGNGAYRHATTLPNPGNDAADIAQALRELGFEVIEGRDLDWAGIHAKVREFARKLDDATMALFFYAGHGVQVDGRNYLVPVDAKLDRAGTLDQDAVDVSSILRPMEAEKRVNLVFLDACRDNPFTRSLARSLGASRSSAVGQGLASIARASGTLITYATEPDRVAADGEGRNSPFTAALLRHIRTPGVEIEIMMKRVRSDVLAATREKQLPRTDSGLLSEVFLKR